ncbi:hypothetical protein AB5I41_01615 [Sphingomonas sp. MMS24-JH45]
MIVRDRQLVVRREMDRRGISLKAVALDSGIPYATIVSYFPGERDRQPATIPVPRCSFWCRAKRFRSTLCRCCCPKAFRSCECLRASTLMTWKTFAVISSRRRRRRTTAIVLRGVSSDCEQTALCGEAGHLRAVA